MATGTTHAGTPTTVAEPAGQDEPDSSGHHRRRRRWRRPVRPTTPVQLMTAIGVTVLLIAATAGAALMSPSAAVALDRESAAAAARNSAGARRIYRQLADTDVAASAIFLSPDGSSRDRRINEYVATADEVQRTLSDAAVDAYGDPGRLRRLLTVANQLRAYRTIVADGVSAGTGEDFATQAVLAAAYAREASSFMSTEVLTSVDRLAAGDRAQQARARHDGRWWRGAAVASPLLVLCVLVGTQWWLWRRTRRRLNPGLLAATALVAVASGTLASTWSHGPAAERGHARLAELTDQQGRRQERLGALLSGRADTYLALGASVSPEHHRTDFLTRALCGSAPGQVDCGVVEGVWIARRSGDAAEYRAAVTSVSQPTGAVAHQFDVAEGYLADQLVTGQRDIDAVVRELPAAPAQHRILTPVLLLLALVAAVAGLLARLRDYR